MKPDEVDRLVVMAVKTATRIRGLSQREIARALGCSQSSACRILAGKRTMTVGELYALAELLRVQPWDLMPAP